MLIFTICKSSLVMSFHIYCPFKNLDLLTEFLEFFMYSQYRSFARCVFCRYAYPTCGLSFYAVNITFHRLKVCYLDEVQVTLLLLIIHQMSHRKSFLNANPRSQRFYVFFQKFYNFSFYIQAQDSFNLHVHSSYGFFFCIQVSSCSSTNY